MKRQLKRIISVILVLTLLVPSVVFADEKAINYSAEVKNGGASITYDAGVATINLNPNNKYMLSGISLKDSEGNAVALEKGDSPLTYIAAIDETKTYNLDYSYRRAIVRTSTEQLSVKPGETKQLYAWLNYSDEDIRSRVNVFDGEVIFTSSNEDVATVDASGKITGIKSGYSVITASAKEGNAVNARCYVLVEDGSEEKIGELTVYARFSLKRLIEPDVGHSFIVFKSYKDGVTIENIDRFFECYAFTEDYYKAIDNYDGSGYDPVSYYYATNGANAKDSNEAARAAHANTLLNQIERVGNMVINKGQIASFGCTTHEGTALSAVPNEFSGDVEEMLERNNLTEEELKKHPIKVLIGAAKFMEELLYDFSIDYNPINGSDSSGGVTLNREAYTQAYRVDTTENVAISIDITKPQFDAMIEYMCYNNYFNIAERNCTEVASTAWNIITAGRPELNMDARLGVFLKSAAAPAVFQIEMLKMGLKTYNDDSVQVKIRHPEMKADVNSGNYN